MILKIRSLVIVSLLAMLFSGVVNALDLPQNDPAASPLLDRIAQGEGGTYDGINSWYVQYTQSAAVVATMMGIPDYFRLSQTPLTEMTINDVIRFQEILKGLNINTPVGRYQVLGSTLIDLKDRYGLSGDEVFDAEMQDRLALALCGYNKWIAGAKTDTEDQAFLYRIAGQWSTVEDPYNPGKSRYGQNVKTYCEELKILMTQIKLRAATPP